MVILFLLGLLASNLIPQKLIFIFSSFAIKGKGNLPYSSKK